MQICPKTGGFQGGVCPKTGFFWYYEKVTKRQKPCESKSLAFWTHLDTVF